MVRVLVLLFGGGWSGVAWGQDACGAQGKVWCTEGRADTSRPDMYGCCPAKGAPAPAPRPSAPAGPSGFGERAGGSGCGMGLVNEGGHCCWPGQAWTGTGCVGRPTRCETPRVSTETACELPACGAGKVRASDGVNCCWPDQGWSSSAGKCVGTPRCPSGFGASGEACEASPTCTDGRELAADLLHCCWPGQSWDEDACVGAPACPEGSVPAGSDCWFGLGALKRVPPGSFMMGSPTRELGRDTDEGPVSVTISRPFLLMEREVTQGMWASVMGSNPSFFSSCGSDCPVEQVSWWDAVSFANAVSALEGLTPAYRISRDNVTWDASASGYRLPTEAEWEWAARGGQSYRYAGSNEVGSVAWYQDNSGGATQPACGQARNGYGLCDMSGNVWEWVWDWYAVELPGGKDPAGASSGSYRVYRGGSWFSDASRSRVANRNGYLPGNRNSDVRSLLGFRLAKPLP